MAHERFMVDHGAGHRTLLWRQPAVAGSKEHVWRDARPGTPHSIECEEDIDGHPVDVFGLPIFGEFVD